MTLNDILLAQNIARQRQSEIDRAWRHDALRAAREVRQDARRQRRERSSASRALRRAGRVGRPVRTAVAVEPRATV